MATRTSTQTGNWGDTATWVGGVVPGVADDAVIAATHTVTINTTGCVALSISVAGVLACSPSVNSSITTQRGIVNTTSGTKYVFDVSSSPTVTCTIAVNASNSGTVAHKLMHLTGNTGCTFKGWHRKRKTYLVTALTAGVSTSCTVADATGWQPGDLVIFAHTANYSDTPQHEERTLTSVSGNVIGWTTPVVYGHVAEGSVGNFTSNLTFTSGNASAQTALSWSRQYGSQSQQKLYRDILFLGGGNSEYNYAGQLSLAFSGGGIAENLLLDVESCAFYKPSVYGHCYTCYGGAEGGITSLSDCVAIIGSVSGPNAITRTFVCGTPLSAVNINGLLALGGPSSNINMWSTGGVQITSNGGSATDIVVCGVTGGTNQNSNVAGIGLELIGIGTAYSNIKTYANKINLYANAVVADITGLYSGYVSDTATATARNYYDIHNRVSQLTLRDSRILGASLGALSVLPQAYTFTLANKNLDITAQEQYRPHMSTYRDNVTTKRSASSIKINPKIINTDCIRTLAIPCGNTQSIRVVGNIQRDTATTAATVTISGLGITPVTYTASAAINQWEQYDLTATNNVAGYDGNLTLTYTANASVSTTSNVYFDGVPDSPFVTKCRHYGFAFDERLPTRTVNPVLTVTEDIAIAYTGVTITGTQITVAAGTADTWAKVYAYSQAYYCANIASDVLLTSTDGNNFAIPLATKLSWPAMGTDGTLVNGWLLLVAGTHTYKLSGTKIDCTNAGDYDFANTVFSGTVELVNSSGGAVTMALPAGTSYTNTGPNITVTVPSLTTTIAANVSLAGAEVRIYDMDNTPAGSLGTELAGTESCPGSTFGFVATAGNTVWVQIMLAGYKEFGQSMVTPAASTTYTYTLRGEVNA